MINNQYTTIKEINNIKVTNIFNNINNIDTLNDYPIICTFYSVDNGYKKYYDKYLEPSLKQFKLPYYAFEILRENKEWEMVGQEKPFFILEVMKLYPNRDVVWLDSDAKVENMPILFLNISKDFAAHYLKKNLCSGTLYFKNSEIGKQILNDWILENNRINSKKPPVAKTSLWDQKTLHTTIDAKYKMNTFILPIEYLGIFDHNMIKGLTIIISHHQASRELKHVFGA